MKKLLFLLASPAFAAITISNIQINATDQEAFISYTTNFAGACTWVVSKSASGGVIGSPIDDVNTTLFPGSNLDSRQWSFGAGYFRQFHVGNRLFAPVASDNIPHSRNLQNSTLYYAQGTCGSATSALLSFQTQNIPFGLGATDPWPVDPAHPGVFAVPSTIGSNPPGSSNPGEQWTDPQTGVLTQRLFTPGLTPTQQGPFYFHAVYNQGLANFYTNATTPTAAATCSIVPSDMQAGGNVQVTGDMTGSPWTNPCYAAGSVTGKYATVAGSTGWLVLRPNNHLFFSNYTDSQFQGTDAGYGSNLQGLQISITGHCTSSNSSLCKINVCLSNNGGASCATNPNFIQQLTLPNGSDSTQTIGNFTPGVYGYDSMLYYSNPKMSRWRISTRTTTVTTSGSTVTRSATLPAYPTASGQDYFIDDYTNGGQGRIRLSNVNKADACNAASSTSSEFFISSGFGNSVNLTTSPGSFTAACLPDWTVMIQRATPDSGSTVQIQNVTFNELSNFTPGWWDTGFESFCDPNSIQSGWLCMFQASDQGGTQVAWINPSSGTINSIGGASMNAKANGANQWNSGTCPLSTPDLIQTFDTNFSLPTWYCVQTDKNGNYSVFQIAYQNSSFVSNSNLIGGQIGQGALTQDDYSLTYAGNGQGIGAVIIKDLTPGCINSATPPSVTCAANQSIGPQIAAFTGQAFDPYLGQGGAAMICFQGPAQKGTVLLYCYRGQNTIGFLAAFSPGDGNPAHSGCAANTTNCNGITGNNVGATPGPGLVGAWNTAQSTGSTQARWATLHSVDDTGNSGHYDAGLDQPGEFGLGQFNCTDLGNETGFCFGSGFQTTTSIVTTNTTIPNTGTDCATYGNPQGLVGPICQLLQINANGNSTNKYEPYYWINTAPQTQVPGELNTAVVGDVFCAGIYPDGCDWVSNPGGTQASTGASWTGGVGIITVSGGPTTFQGDSTISVNSCSAGGWNATSVQLIGVNASNNTVAYALPSNPGVGSTGCVVTDGVSTRNQKVGVNPSWIAGAAVYVIPNGTIPVNSWGSGSFPTISQCSITAYNTNPLPASLLGYTTTTWASELDSNPGGSATGCMLTRSYGSDLLMLVQKNANGSWVFERNVVDLSTYSTSGTTYPSWQATATQPIVLSLQQNTANINANSAAVSGGGTWFWNTDPHGNSIGGLANNRSLGGHLYSRAYSQLGGPSSGSIGGGSPIEAYRANYIPGYLTGGPVIGQQFMLGAYQFNGVQRNGMPSWQSHPNPPGDSSNTTYLATGYDFRPLYGDFASQPSGNTVFSLVGGTSQLWVATPATVTDADDVIFDSTLMFLHRKLFATHALSSAHPLLDISGIGSSIADGSANAYEFCVVRIAGECFAGSTVGQIYANVPGVVFNYCNGNVGNGFTLGYVNQLCIGDMSPSMQAVNQIFLNSNDGTGINQRVIVKTMTGQGQMLENSTAPSPDSARNLPDSSWSLFGCHYFDGLGRNTCMALNPPLTGVDSISRNNYDTFNVGVSAPTGAGINNVIAQFGYAEYGQAGIPYCTTRLDACYATAATVPSGNSPFKFQSDGASNLVSNITGLACTTSCTIAIPAISQRILYYRLFYRSSTNQILSQTPWTMAATP